MKSYINFTESNVQKKDFNPIVKLLGSEDNIEITRYELGKNSMFFINPSIQMGTYEFYYIASGSIIYNNKEYSTHGFFEAYNIDEPFKIKALEDTVIIFISSRSGEFSNAEEFNENLVNQLESIQNKDHYTFEHCRRVKRYVHDIGEYLELPDSDIKNLVIAAYFHDVGKIMIPDTILNKPDKLTSVEFDLMKTHVTHSEKIIKEVLGAEISDILVLHHERLDGSGYPKGKKNIPLLGRILAVVDSFDAMTTDRIYKKGKSPEEAISELLLLNHQYDQKIVKVLEKLIIK